MVYSAKRRMSTGIRAWGTRSVNDPEPAKKPKEIA
jgi:hypothetical protein